MGSYMLMLLSWYSPPMRTVAFCLALALLSFAPLASAENRRLARANRLLQRQDYMEARQLFRRILRSGDLSPEEVQSVYAGLAESNAALRRPEEAAEAYFRLLLLQPEHYVPSDASPVIREPFVQAQTRLHEAGDPYLHWDPPESIEPGQPLRIDLDVPEDLDPPLVGRVEVTFHVEPNGEDDTITADGPEVTIPAERLDGATSVSVSMTVFDGHGNLLASIGSADEPLTVPIVEPPPAPAVAGEMNPGEETSSAPHRRPWYQRWWFWTIVGAVVVGTAVSLSVGVATAGTDSCEEALGGPCMVVNVGQ